MNENAQKWVAALRSGEFKQGREWLRTADDGFCCLGVACELYRRETGDGEWELNGSSSAWFFVLDDIREGGVLPGRVRAWLGVGHTDGGSCVTTPLTRLNDAGRGFHQIADFIEEHEAVLFKEATDA